MSDGWIIDPRFDRPIPRETDATCWVPDGCGTRLVRDTDPSLLRCERCGRVYHDAGLNGSAKQKGK